MNLLSSGAKQMWNSLCNMALGWRHRLLSPAGHQLSGLIASPPMLLKLPITSPIATTVPLVALQSFDVVILVVAHAFVKRIGFLVPGTGTHLRSSRKQLARFVVAVLIALLVSSSAGASCSFPFHSRDVSVIQTRKLQLLRGSK